MIIVFLFLTVTIITAQNKTKDKTKFFQKITAGLIVGISASDDFSGTTNPFSMGYGISGNVLIVTPATFHNFLYRFSDNSVRSVNGYFLPRNWDTYVVYSKVLNSDKNYLGVAIERLLKAGDVKFFSFCELGTDLKNNKSLSIGILVSLQNILWHR